MLLVSCIKMIHIKRVEFLKLKNTVFFNVDLTTLHGYLDENFKCRDFLIFNKQNELIWINNDYTFLQSLKLNIWLMIFLSFAVFKVYFD